MNIFKAELQRIATRRITKVAAGLVTFGIVLTGVMTFINHANAEPDMAAAQQLSAESTASCMQWATAPDSGIAAADAENECFSDPMWFLQDQKFHFSEVVTSLENSQFAADDVAAEPTWVDVRKMVQERGDVYAASDNGLAPLELRPEKQAAYGFSGGLISLSTLLVLAAALLGASYIGADWRSGVIESQLVRVPNRVRLMGAKFAAVATATAAGTLAFMVLYLLVVVPSAVWRGDFGLASTPFWLDLVGVMGRSTVVAAVMAVIGGSLALLARNTVAGVVGVLLAFIGGGFLVNTGGRWTSFVTLEANLNAFVARADVPYILIEKMQDGGQIWTRVVSYGYLSAGALLVAAAIAAMTLSGVSFARRDVS